MAAPAFVDTPTLYRYYLEAQQRVSTDTRSLKGGELFFALKGEHFDANLFAAQALEQGAAYVIMDNPSAIPNNDPRYRLVPDSLSALQALAAHYRRQWQFPVLAIGGSNGKTTTKELIKAVLATRYRTFATPGNLNNHIGVPLSILATPPDTQIGVLELGANHIGEIALLCEIAQPTHGLITNIGLDHLEGFGSLEGVAQANSELYYYLLKNGGLIFVNSQEPHLLRMAARFPRERQIRYPQPTDDFCLTAQEGGFFVRYQASTGHSIQTQLFGQYNFFNIASALCVGHHFQVAEAAAHEAVAAYAPSNNRSQVVQKGSNTILLDAYNANPSSMEQAIVSFGKIAAKQKMVILGDMYELGEASTEAHRNLGAQVATQQFDIVVFFGQMIQPALEHNPKAYYFNDKFSLHNWLQDQALTETHVLVKGSRGVKLETVLDFI
ncbi:UDP-N-acetylmuramoyl-tripeptide--D-alanyl-D-alanine ligase [Eisenibacter elegans]|uniref:UDP-N-acetylmuramoyl-tripeptide--D-alanyl-D- alanine ligase n=1 Tax=Eisenibacter elegans TaxID=997 RepID=UPI000406E80C|nr:UDP-N-acetylmuramoyl-tripeptide--D-alanyl-D-alanine ligase [Eisenibacter elegans]